MTNNADIPSEASAANDPARPGDTAVPGDALVSDPAHDQVGSGRTPLTRTVRFAWAAVVVLLIGVIVLVVLALTDSRTTLVVNRPEISQAVVHDLAAVPQSTFDAVGVNAPNTPLVPPVLLHNQPLLTVGGKPDVLYVGAEYCSFCASERWALVVALSRFGTFAHLRNMQSSSTAVFPSIQTFSFDGATYQSQYLTFTGLEEYSDVPGTDGTFTRIATPTAFEQALIDRFGPISVPGGDGPVDGRQFPFIDIGNRAVTGTSTFSPAVIEGLSQASIADHLNDPANSVSRAVIASANYLTAAICIATDQQPSSLCTSKGVRAAASSMAVG